MYLNTIFYGSQTYGIEAGGAHPASKPMLTISTWRKRGLLAGLPQAPTPVQPLINLAAAKKRQTSRS